MVEIDVGVGGLDGVMVGGRGSEVGKSVVGGGLWGMLLEEG